MLTCCGCVANAEQTQILTPCQLHAAWAKTYAAQTWGDDDPTRRLLTGAGVGVAHLPPAPVVERRRR